VEKDGEFWATISFTKKLPAPAMIVELRRAKMKTVERAMEKCLLYTSSLYLAKSAVNIKNFNKIQTLRI